MPTRTLPTMSAAQIDLDDGADATLELIDREFQAYRESATAESAAAAEAVGALESQLSLTARDNVRLRAQLDKAQKQVAMLSAKLDARSTWESTTSNTHAHGHGHGHGADADMMVDVPTHTKTAYAASGQLKEEIYQDLTGLVISRVERGAEESVLTCIQTGRNGTLHYRLLWPRDRDEQIVYTPLLDDGDATDCDLRDILPDYLAEQIMFKQDQAALFAYRLWTAIQKKV